MKIISEVLEKYSKEFEIELTYEQLLKFERYADFLIEWNKKFNLTAITQPDEIAIKHFLDSLLTLKVFEFVPGSKGIDIGTGAGLPGIPLAIARKDLDLTLVDSLNKRIKFLDEVKQELELNLENLHVRAQDLAFIPEFRESFDFCISRAVAPLNVLLELCIPFLKTGGVFIAMKGLNAAEEIKNAQNALKVLNSTIIKIKNLVLPQGGTRELILIKKNAPIDKKYPRRNTKLNKSPL